MEKIGVLELRIQRRPVIVGVMKRLSISDAERAKECGADIIELRVDLLEGEEKSIEKVKEFAALLRAAVPVIVTNRREEEGGSFTGTEEERIGMLDSILETADAVDVEFFAPESGKRALIAKAERLRVPVILSFHDFNGMPSREELWRILTEMYREGGSIAKIAVTPKTISDALFLLNLTYNLSSEGKFVVTIGMGPVGRHLRVIAPLYGSALSYGYIEGEEGVAPGQFSVKELRHIMEHLGFGVLRPYST